MNVLRNDVKQELIKAQESKMQTVVIYRFLAEKAKDEEVKANLLRMASDEGKHAGVFRKFTQTTIKRGEKPAFRFRMMYTFFRLKNMLRLMLQTEQRNVESFRAAAKQNPALRDVLKDGRRHVELLNEMLAKKKK